MALRMSMMLVVSCGSRLAVGSSARITAGDWARARAMATRCCSPPESASGDADDARRRLDQPVDRAQERRLASPALAEDDDELAGADGEVDPLEGYRRGREDDGEPRDLDHRVHADPRRAERSAGADAEQVHRRPNGVVLAVLGGREPVDLVESLEQGSEGGAV